MLQNREKFQRKVGFLGRKYVTMRGECIKAHDLQGQLQAEKMHQQLCDIVNNASAFVYLNYNAESLQIRKKWQSEKQKKKRAREKLQWMFDAYDNLHFVTLTFSDAVLDRTTAQTRHRYAQRWLNDNCKDYLANVDFGKTNGREHYHAVVSLKENTSEWLYGFTKFKPVRRGTAEKHSFYHLSGYLVKLANHSGKSGSGRIFTRKGYKEVDNIPF